MAITKEKIAGPAWDNERCENLYFSVFYKRISYVTDLFDNRLGCACNTDVYTVFDKPNNIEEPADSLGEVANEK